MGGIGGYFLKSGRWGVVKGRGMEEEEESSGRRRRCALSVNDTPFLHIVCSSLDEM